jgi:hypothetical protein
MAAMSDYEFHAIFNEARDAAIAAVETFYAKHGDPMYCGFAWVTVAGNTSFGRKAKALGKARPANPKGLQFWANEATVGKRASWTQSMDMKEAAMYAFCAVLRKHGIDASSDSRAD